MTTPKSSVIRMKALGLHWRAGEILVFDVHDERGAVRGVRPLGGGVEFGETSRAAVTREFQEELGVAATVLSGPLVLENLFVDRGEPRHEVLFLYDVEFPPGAFEGEEEIHFLESDGSPCVARWRAPEDLDQPGAPALYPAGLKAALRARKGEA